MISQRILRSALAGLIVAVPFSAYGQHTGHGAASPGIAASAPAGPGVYELASDGRGTLYVAVAGSQADQSPALVVFDAATLQEKRRIALPTAAPYGVGINARTGIVYTTNTRAGNVTAIDVATGRVLATIVDSLEPRAHLFRVLVDEETNTIYASVTGGRIWVIDGATNSIKRIIPNVGATTVGLALDRAKNTLYAANSGHNEVAVVDLATDRVVRRIKTGGERSTIVDFDPASRRLFVSNQGTGDLSVINVDSAKVVSKIETGGGALGVSFVKQNGRVYVANRQAGTVSVIDAARLVKVADIQLQGYPNTLYVDATGAVFVTAKMRPVEGGEPVGDKVFRLTTTPGS